MMPPQTIEPTALIEIILQATEWNTLLNILMDAPYRVASPLIQKISEQAQASVGLGSAKTNGAADHAPH